jgi:predicted RNase H-like nuclease (RuvC/YqgF family)
LYHNYYNYFENLEHRFKELEEQHRELNEENKKLKDYVENLKPVHIENINYKIQELIVRELKGTLNIGLTSLTDADELKKLLGETEQGEDIHLQDMDQQAESCDDEHK